MPITRRGIYHNLKESEYSISNSEVEYFFSSRFYLNKFMIEYKEHREAFKSKVDKTFIDHPFKTNFIADLHLYKEIEKRGFRVVYKGVNITWRNLHLLGLAGKIGKNTIDWYEIQNQK